MYKKSYTLYEKIMYQALNKANDIHTIYGKDYKNHIFSYLPNNNNALNLIVKKISINNNIIFHNITKNTTDKIFLKLLKKDITNILKKDHQEFYKLLKNCNKSGDKGEDENLIFLKNLNLYPELLTNSRADKINKQDIKFIHLNETKYGQIKSVNQIIIDKNKKKIVLNSYTDLIKKDLIKVNFLFLYDKSTTLIYMLNCKNILSINTEFENITIYYKRNVWFSNLDKTKLIKF